MNITSGTIQRATRALAVTTAATLFALCFGASATADPAATDKSTVDKYSVEDLSDIEGRYWDEPQLRELLGQPVDREQQDGRISYQQYQHGWLYYTHRTGVHEIHGDIATKFNALGGHRVLGVPETDELGTPDGIGRYNHFTGANPTGATSIYWTPDIGARGIWGHIREHWADQGYETGPLGYPTTSTAYTSDEAEYNDFVGPNGDGASVYWTEDTGTHSVQGKIRELYLAMGRENGLGYPTTDEREGGFGGRYNEFTGTTDAPAAVYWHADTGAHFMRGTIYEHYETLNKELSYLRYPTTDQRALPNGDWQVDFQGGFIRVDHRTGEATDGRW